MATLAERLAAKCIPENGCLIWHGATINSGYGIIGNGDKKLITVHRLAWILNNGEIPGNLLIRHKCSNKLCVNPEHLELGTHSDNLRDAWARKERVYSESKLQTKIIKWIRDNKGLVIKLVGVQQRGVPDLYVVAPTGQAVFVEVKVPGGTLTELQKNMHEELAKRHHRPLIVFTIEQAISALLPLWETKI